MVWRLGSGAIGRWEISETKEEDEEGGTGGAAEEVRQDPSGVIFWMVTWTSGIEGVDADRLEDLIVTPRSKLRQ
jgi:hypothetical protein